MTEIEVVGTMKKTYSFEPNEQLKKKSHTNVYLKANSTGVAELPLDAFANWYIDLPFASHVKSIKDWLLRVIILYPNALQSKKAIDVKERLTFIKKVKKLLFQFYKSCFNPSAADIASMKRCVKSDVSVLIIAMKTTLKANLEAKVCLSWIRTYLLLLERSVLYQVLSLLYLLKLIKPMLL